MHFDATLITVSSPDLWDPNSLRGSQRPNSRFKANALVSKVTLTDRWQLLEVLRKKLL